MSALMAERRDWAEDPRQASLFDALAQPPERAQPEQGPEAPREEAQIVEFPKRPATADAPNADPTEVAPNRPTDTSTPELASQADAAPSTVAAPPAVAPRGDAATPAPPSAGAPRAAAAAAPPVPAHAVAPPAAAAPLAPPGAQGANAAPPAPAVTPRAGAVPPAPAPAVAPRAAAGTLAPPPGGAAPADTAPAAAGASAIEAEIVVAPENLSGDETYTPRVAGSPLAGPTLDDVMSRVWEGLVTGLPAACPVCHGEVLPSLHGPLRGHCTSCGTTID